MLPQTLSAATTARPPEPWEADTLPVRLTGMASPQPASASASASAAVTPGAARRPTAMANAKPDLRTVISSSLLPVPALPIRPEAQSACVIGSIHRCMVHAQATCSNSLPRGRFGLSRLNPVPRPSPVTDAVKAVIASQERHAWALDELL